MENTTGNEGINKLAGVLQSRMRSIGEKPRILDFGSIQSDMSLITNRFPKPIPQSDYLVCRQLTLGAENTPIYVKPLTQENGDFDGRHGLHVSGNGRHRHILLIPEKMRSLKAGDRVLVAWVGDDACVIDIILPATAL